MQLYLIICIFIITILILLFVKPGKNNASINRINKIEQIYEEINEYINLYNEKNREFSTLSDKIRISIFNSNDQEAIYKYENISKTIEKKIKEAYAYTNSTIKLLNSGKYDEGRNNISILKEIFEQINSSLDEMKKIRVINKADDYVFTATESNAAEYFIGCKSKEEAEKRYKSLSKVLHPDSKTGDEDLFIKMKLEYESLNFR